MGSHLSFSGAAVLRRTKVHKEHGKHKNVLVAGKDIVVKVQK